MCPNEQRCRGDKSRRAGQYPQYIKRRCSRFFRRLAKRDPEGAPMKRGYRGYSL